MFENRTGQHLQEIPPEFLFEEQKRGYWVLREEKSEAQIRATAKKRLTFSEHCILSDEAAKRAFDPARFKNGPVPTP